jgi:hypothetical protein
MDQKNQPKFHPNPKLKLMDQVREVLRYHHYSYRTEQTYCQWILRYPKSAIEFDGAVFPVTAAQKIACYTQRHK